MPVKGYEAVTIKTEVVQRIRDFIDKHPEQGYKSIAEFVTDAIRTKLNELLKEITAQEVEA